MTSFFDDEELGEMDPIEAEVDAIRHQIWEEVKDMTIDEHIAYFDRETADVRKQFRMKESRLQPLKLIPREPDEIYSELPYPE